MNTAAAVGEIFTSRPVVRSPWCHRGILYGEGFYGISINHYELERIKWFHTVSKAKFSVLIKCTMDVCIISFEKAEGLHYWAGRRCTAVVPYYSVYNKSSPRRRPPHGYEELSSFMWCEWLLYSTVNVLVSGGGQYSVSFVRLTITRSSM